MPQISILMPAYNAGKYIGESVSSLLSQTFPDFELIILNDGSTDDTEAEVLKFTDSRIRYFKNEANRGLAFTRNRLIGLAEAAYLAFLDSDDVAAPGRLAMQLNYLDTHPEIALVSGSMHGSQDGKTDRKSFVFDLSPEALPVHLLFYNPVSTSSVMIRRSALPEIHFRDTYPPVEDYDLWTRTLYEHKGVVLKAVLGYYRLHAHSISKQLSADSYANRNRVVLDQLEHYFPGPFNAEEKDLHVSLADLSRKNNPEDLLPLYNWVLKLYKLNAAAGVFDKRILASVLFERMLKKYLRLSRYQPAVFRNLMNLKNELNPFLTFESKIKMGLILLYSVFK